MQRKLALKRKKRVKMAKQLESLPFVVRALEKEEARKVAESLDEMQRRLLGKAETRRLNRLKFQVCLFLFF